MVSTKADAVMGLTKKLKIFIRTMANRSSNVPLSDTPIHGMSALLISETYNSMEAGASRLISRTTALDRFSNAVRTAFAGLVMISLS